MTIQVPTIPALGLYPEFKLFISDYTTTVVTSSGNSPQKIRRQT